MNDPYLMIEDYLNNDLDAGQTEYVDRQLDSDEEFAGVFAAYRLDMLPNRSVAEDFESGNLESLDMTKKAENATVAEKKHSRGWLSNHWGRFAAAAAVLLVIGVGARSKIGSIIENQVQSRVDTRVADIRKSHELRAAKRELAGEEAYVKIKDSFVLFKSKEYEKSLDLAKSIDTKLLAPSLIVQKQILELQALSALKEYELVISNGDQFIETSPWLRDSPDNHAEVLKFTADAQRNLGNFGAADEIYREALSLGLSGDKRYVMASKYYPILLRQGETRKAAQVVLEVPELRMQIIGFDQFIQNTRNGVPSEDYAEFAEYVFSVSKKPYGERVFAASNLISAKLSLKKFDEAEAILEDVERYIRDNNLPTGLGITNAKGELAMHRHDFVAAERIFSQLEESYGPAVLWKNVAITKFQHAVALAQLEKVDMAAKKFDAAVKLAIQADAKSDLAFFLELEQAKFLSIHGSKDEIQSSERLLAANANRFVELSNLFRTQMFVSSELQLN